MKITFTSNYSSSQPRNQGKTN